MPDTELEIAVIREVDGALSKLPEGPRRRVLAFFVSRFDWPAADRIYAASRAVRKEARDE